jgi:hypothetical protein
MKPDMLRDTAVAAYEWEHGTMRRFLRHPWIILSIFLTMPYLAGCTPNHGGLDVHYGLLEDTWQAKPGLVFARFGDDDQPQKPANGPEPVKPQSGYEWVNPYDDNDFSVRPKHVEPQYSDWWALKGNGVPLECRQKLIGDSGDGRYQWKISFRNTSNDAVIFDFYVSDKDNDGANFPVNTRGAISAGTLTLGAGADTEVTVTIASSDKFWIYTRNFRQKLL